MFTSLGLACAPMPSVAAAPSILTVSKLQYLLMVIIESAL